MALVRGDAYRLVGREIEARRAFAEAARGGSWPPPRTRRADRRLDRRIPDPSTDPPIRRRSRVTERTLVLVKPDGVQRQLTGRILARYEERGLKVVGPQARPGRARPRRAPLRGPSREAVLRRPGRVHHVRAARRPRPRGPERDRRRPRDQRRDAPARGGARHHPRRLRARDRAEHRPRVRRPRGRRRRSSRCGSRPASCSTTSATSTAGSWRRRSRRRSGRRERRLASPAADGLRGRARPRRDVDGAARRIRGAADGASGLERWLRIARVRTTRGSRRASAAGRRPPATRRTPRTTPPAPGSPAAPRHRSR